MGRRYQTVLRCDLCGHEITRDGTGTPALVGWSSLTLVTYQIHGDLEPEYDDNFICPECADKIVKLRQKTADGTEE